MSAHTEALKQAREALASNHHFHSARPLYDDSRLCCVNLYAIATIDAALSLPDPSAAPVVPQWLPIESAPADMTECVAVRWVDSEGEECRGLDYTEDGCWMGWHDHAEHTEIIGGHGVSYTPPYIGWHPLPPAPQQGEQAGQEGVQG